jgi:phosphopantothenoylcysteine decarboxylase/phosphopantothenate--cysteine ligase
VALGVGGGIAAYKACEVARQLIKAGAEVRVAMTPAAQQFVTSLTFQNLTGRPVLTDLLDPAQDATFGHIELARWADLFVVAPATADLLARIRAGFAQDAVTTSLLAYRGNVLLAPAMNTVMWENVFTQENVRALVAQPRFRTVGPGAGLLACGEVGSGRLAEPEELVNAIAQLAGEGPLRGKRVLVTAGPTREYFDPVRYLSNPSTGKMGLAMAAAARALGAQVTVVLGPVGADASTDRRGLEVVDVVSAEDMAREVLSRVEQSRVLVAAAAVSDHRPETIHAQKQKKDNAPLEMKLVRTPDVLAQAAARVAKASPRPLLVGFAAETEQWLENARAKLDQKQLDFIVANDVSVPGSGFAGDTNRVMVLRRGGEQVPFEGTKREVADGIWNLLIPEVA